MAKGLIEDSTLTAIAGAIRTKTNTTDTMTPSEMAAKIAGITGAAKMTYGSHTMAIGSTTMTVEHDLGVVPNVIYVCLVGDDTIGTNIIRLVISLVLCADGTGWFCHVDTDRKFKKLPINSDTISTYITTLDSTTLTVESNKTGKPSRFSTTYYWFAGVKE